MVRRPIVLFFIFSHMDVSPAVQCTQTESDEKILLL
jgi:hypothetical protein